MTLPPLGTESPHQESPYKGKTGLRRIWNALHYSMAGLQAAFRHEDAFRQELLLSVLLMARLPEFQAQKVEEAFDAQGARLSLRLPRDQAGGLRDLLMNLSKGRAFIEPEQPE